MAGLLTLNINAAQTRGMEPFSVRFFYDVESPGILVFTEDQIITFDTNKPAEIVTF